MAWVSTAYVPTSLSVARVATMTQVRLEKAALREKEELNGKWLQILEAARRERVDLDATSSALRGRCAVLKERRGRLQQEVDRSRAQLFTIAADGGRCVWGVYSWKRMRWPLDR